MEIYIKYVKLIITDTAIIAGAKTIPGSFIKKLFEIAAKYCKIDECPYLKWRLDNPRITFSEFKIPM